jgi:ActR/RegA family two-component response regulator
MQQPDPNAQQNAAATNTQADPAEDWPTLDVLRLRYIHRAIEHMNNNKTRAAELLGIDRRTLNRILARERARRRAAVANGANGTNGAATGDTTH